MNFLEAMFYENYLTSDLDFAYSSKWRPIQFNSIQFNLFALNKKIQHKYIIDDTQYSYYYNIHT